MRARGPRQRGLAGMIRVRVTRDEAKLRGVDFVTFNVCEYCPNFPNKDKASFCGYYVLPGAVVMEAGQDPWLPVEQAFEATRLVALKKDILAILINDPEQKLDVGPWKQVQNRLIDDLDDHS
jgi:hypothetical protein